MGKHRCQELGLCTAGVRYSISVNTSTNPYLQVDAFPNSYQASSIISVCQSTGREPDQIPIVQHCMRAEKACASLHSLPPFWFVQAKSGPMPALTIAVTK